ncbi:hypothetical protein [Dyadobacter fermentans]|uniref:Uncharacterized protein n=1 Tax=Dyadobacter fermentans (strain ATCC 700827 / DSM 18053 / CIP 107007 / KCTC 52180 / NS114) TaxID=471854 RepID=C6VYF7_DYAFD|nr:hypothetical protein [Dyadobacter fermentans]ACT91636.1 hypothetical protein Dfer_0367 [Dyadobacter fermentans DSM 18053]
MATIDIPGVEALGDQEETLGTAEDLREEVVLDIMQQEIVGSMVKIEFETSLGLCTGHYLSTELGHEEINLEADSFERLKRLFPTCNGAFVHPANRDWVEVSVAESIGGLPEYKIYSRIVTGGIV